LTARFFGAAAQDILRQLPELRGIEDLDLAPVDANGASA
jgi:hypothetical protein